jgi:hypothetical protein
MQMLHAAGLPCVTDGQRPGDADNPRGYFEAECVKQLRGGDANAVLEIIRGRAVKIIYRLLYHLPAPCEADVLFVRRDLREVLSSQAAMLARRGHPLPLASDECPFELYAQEVAQFEEWLARRSDLRTRVVSYGDLVTEPRRTATRVAEFLGMPHAVEAMSRVVDVSLYRQRVHAS